MNRHTHPPPTTQQQRISNFLYPAENLGAGVLPERFVEFCRDSIQRIKGAALYAESATDPTLGLTELDGGEGSYLDVRAANKEHMIRIIPTKSNRPVVAIDTSTIKLGELEAGSLCALRGAAVLLENGQYRYVRYGPLVFSLGDGGISTCENLQSLGLPPFHGEPNVDGLLKRIRNLLERWLQFNMSNVFTNGFILIDGSLTAGTPDNPSRELERILDGARRSGSVVIAISKKTKLRIRNQSVTGMLEKESDPCLLDIDDEITEQFPPYPVRFLGRVFVGKLARSGFPFRMDVDREVPMADTISGLCELAGTDIVDQGYPETLRMAHILSTFTASDVLAIQTLAAVQFGVQLIPKIALRRSLFGPFGTAWEAWH
jgi:hypothetical protein